jgi:hypothetical protein
MTEPLKVIGEAVFIRTDTPDFAEEVKHFQTLEEMIRICSHSFPGLALERIMINGRNSEQEYTVALGLISACREAV